MINKDKNGNEILSKRQKKKKKQTSVCPFQTTISRLFSGHPFCTRRLKTKEGSNPERCNTSSKWIQTLAQDLMERLVMSQVVKRGSDGGNGFNKRVQNCKQKEGYRIGYKSSLKAAYYDPFLRSLIAQEEVS